MSSASAENSPGDGRHDRGGFIRSIEWRIAWRHLRCGPQPPTWSRVLVMVGIYVVLAGLGFLLHALADVDLSSTEQVFSQAELDPSDRWFGVFGAMGLFFGTLLLLLGGLGRLFNLLATIISMSVLVGCTALVVVLSLMTGLEEDLRDKILNQKAHILVSSKDENRFSDYPDLVEALRAAPGVVGASPYVEGEVMAKSGMNRQGAVLLGVLPDRVREVSNLEDIVRRGRFEALGDKTAIVDDDPLVDLAGGTPWRLRHLQGEAKPNAEPVARARTLAVVLPLAMFLGLLLFQIRGRSWREWLPPAAIVLALSIVVAMLAPAGPQRTQASLVLPPPPDAAVDPMLERLRPKASAADNPDRESGDTDGTTGTETPAGESVRQQESKEMPAALSVPAGFGAREPAADEPGDDAADEGWEDPVQVLGLDAPPPAELIRGPEAKGQSSNEAVAKELAALRLPPPRSKQDIEDERDGWEDPLEVLGVEPPPEPDPATGSGGRNPGQGGEPAQGGEQGIPDAILLGNELAMELAVRVGARVQLITPIGRMTPAGRVPGLLATRVGGIFYSGNYEYDRKNIYGPLRVVQAFLRTGDRVSGIEVKLADVDQLAQGRSAVQAVLRAQGRGDELRAQTWQELNKNLFTAMLLEKIAMAIALLFVVLVASFGILASNLMSVLEKAKEIAILKAMGSTDRQIERVFVAEGLCLGFLGALGGLLLGLGLCAALARFGFPFDENVYYMEILPVVVNPAEVAVVGLAALGIIWLSSLYPARVASRMRPVDGLRESDK
jgi:lipoprotein-releasing system permease protein